MSTIRSLYSSTTPRLNLFTSGRSESRTHNKPCHLLGIPRLNHGFCSSVVKQVAHPADISRRMCNMIIHATMDDDHQPAAPQPRKPNSPIRWMLLLILPFANLKGGKLLRLVGLLSQVEKVAKAVEDVAEVLEEVAEVVEEVAEVAERVSSEMAENLPGNGMLKQAALVVEHVSKVVKDAKLTIDVDVMHKVEEVEALVKVKPEVKEIE